MSLAQARICGYSAAKAHQATAAGFENPPRLHLRMGEDASSAKPPGRSNGAKQPSAHLLYRCSPPCHAQALCPPHTLSYDDMCLPNLTEDADHFIGCLRHEGGQAAYFPSVTGTRVPSSMPSTSTLPLARKQSWSAAYSCAKVSEGCSAASSGTPKMLIPKGQVWRSGPRS